MQTRPQVLTHRTTTRLSSRGCVSYYLRACIQAPCYACCPCPRAMHDASPCTPPAAHRSGPPCSTTHRQTMCSDTRCQGTRSMRVKVGASTCPAKWGARTCLGAHSYLPRCSVLPRHRHAQLLHLQQDLLSPCDMSGANHHRHSGAMPGLVSAPPPPPLAVTMMWKEHNQSPGKDTRPDGRPMLDFKTMNIGAAKRWVGAEDACC